MNTFRVGDSVMVTAKDDFYAYIDGWRGRVIGFQAGCVNVKVPRDDIEMEFFVPADQLVLTVGAA